MNKKKRNCRELIVGLRKGGWVTLHKRLPMSKLQVCAPVFIFKSSMQFHTETKSFLSKVMTTDIAVILDDPLFGITAPRGSIEEPEEILGERVKIDL